MSDRKKRVIKSTIYEDERQCAGCGKQLAGTSGMIHIIVPGAGHVEYCSWRCMHMHTKRLLELRVEAMRHAAHDLLTDLGYTRRYGESIDPRELDRPIDESDTL